MLFIYLWIGLFILLIAPYIYATIKERHGWNLEELRDFSMIIIVTGAVAGLISIFYFLSNHNEAVGREPRYTLTESYDSDELTDLYFYVENRNNNFNSYYRIQAVTQEGTFVDITIPTNRTVIVRERTDEITLETKNNHITTIDEFTIPIFMVHLYEEGEILEHSGEWSFEDRYLLTAPEDLPLERVDLEENE